MSGTHGELLRGIRQSVRIRQNSSFFETFRQRQQFLLEVFWTEYKREILDKTEDFVSELELAEKIRKNELDSIRAEERWLWILQRAD